MASFVRHQALAVIFSYHHTLNIQSLTTNERGYSEPLLLKQPHPPPNTGIVYSIFRVARKHSSDRSTSSRFTCIYIVHIQVTIAYADIPVVHIQYITTCNYKLSYALRALC